MLAEVEYWRNILRNLPSDITRSEYEFVTQALILAQNKLIAYEMEIPISVYPESRSVAYH